jgi:hypothetical protein
MSAVTTFRIQRLALLVSEVWIVAYIPILVYVRHNVGAERGPLLWLGIPTVLFWAFLFFGSPFLVTRQRGLALAGWAIATAVFLCSPLL